MNKKYIVELTDDEGLLLQGVVRKLAGSSQKIKRANILLKADVCGPDGLMRRLPRHLSAEPRPSRTYVSDLRQKGLKSHSTEKSERNRRLRSFSTGKQGKDHCHATGYGSCWLRQMDVAFAARKVVGLEIVGSVVSAR